ncbi:MAG: penicillin-binding protein activator, partial [Gammaproteobacteria bacterium]|nr:penicillin-binding protein activator [Gammaproteobacteria bacterium]
AQLEGADFIVGPLLPAEVNSIRTQAGFVPTLLLNFSSAPAPAATNLFEFSLSPDDEAASIAERAIAAGRETAVILHASNDTGRRLSQSFANAFIARGGRIIDTAEYVPQSQNSSAAIKRILNINQSEQRFERLRANLGRNIEFEPRRREDIDLIFLQADPSDGRLLVPQLRLHNAEGIPTYSTSSVYDPSRTGSDADLNGLMFPDLPTLVFGEADPATPVGLLNQYATTNAERWIRFFAFGYDAYRLVDQLFAGLNGNWPFAGATGELFLDADGRVRRRLPFAEFRQGRPAPIDPPAGTRIMSDTSLPNSGRGLASTR